MDDSQAIRRAVEQYRDWRWRLNNLYWITNKSGNRVQFKTNWAQEALYNDMWYCNVILKARQLGFTTFLQIFMLDACVFNSDVRAGTIAHKMDDAKVIFRDKIKYAYDNLPAALRDAVPAVSDTALELLLANNSSIRVGTSMRSGTLQYLHVSEYGKICAKFPDKAREVRTGSLNTVEAGEMVFIESTAEGQEGDFFDLCQQAETMEREEVELSKLDYKFHFFPWWEEPSYELDPRTVVINDDMKRYFRDLEAEHGITCTPAQMAWYQKKLERQQDDMKREYPSTAAEAFEASVEGAYYGKQMNKAEYQGRVGHYPADPDYPVNTAWDIGFHDATAIWCFQCLPHEIRNVGYYENHGEFLDHYVEELERMADEHGWTYGKDYVPHDIRVNEWAAGKIRIEAMIEQGRRPVLVPNIAVEDGINAVRTHMAICTWDKAGCASGLKALKSYCKQWDADGGTWKSHPRAHHWANHGADGFRYEILGYKEFKPTEPLPEGPRDPRGRMVPQHKRPEVLTDMTYDAFIKLQEKFEKNTRV